VRARAILLSLALWSCVAGILVAQAPQPLPSPETFFGFALGTDGRLAGADEIEKYFQAVAASSDRVKLIDLGQTTEGHRTIAAIVSAPANIRNLDQIRAANQQLADPRTLGDAEAKQLAASHKAIVAIGASIHATEVGATQTSAQLLYDLASATDALTLEELDHLVVIVIPMLNPDGHRLVVDWYNKNKGTTFEGGPMPWPDHKYAGHDINRDAFMMNLAESRNLARFFYREWHPQVFLSMHQMDDSGARFFVPPVADPVDPNVDPIVWREAALLGSAMTLQLERDGHAGVVSGSLFDYYSPGYEDTAPLGHNTVCLLTEAARVNVATPIDEPAAEGELTVPRVGAPHPWPGGRWSLHDIVEYERSAVGGLLRSVDVFREDLVWNFYAMGKRAVESGRTSGPYAFLIPPSQYDPVAAVKLEQLLLEGGVEIQRASELFTANGVSYPSGTDIVLLAQPYRAYIKTLMERQDYPLSAAAGEHPYDVTGWTLPAQMGVDVRVIDHSFESPVMSRLTAAALVAPPSTIWGDKRPAYYLVEARGTAGALAVNRLIAANVKASWLEAPLDIDGFHFPAGSLVVPAVKNIAQPLQNVTRPFGLRVDAVRGKLPAARAVSRSRVGLYKPWGDNTDEGWTRWVLEQYEFPFATIPPADVRLGNLRGRFDAIILPSAAPQALADGLGADQAPAPYGMGLGTEGLQALDAFVRGGGTLICLDQAGGLAIDLFKLSVKDVARDAGDKLLAPGTIVHIDVDEGNPLSFGIPARTSGVFASSAAYDVAASPNVTTAARYAKQDLRVSGLLTGGDVLEGKSAVISATVDAGRVVLLGFRVQHRAQSLATFRFLFNAIYLSK
jgi:hypothetical protein